MKPDGARPTHMRRALYLMAILCSPVAWASSATLDAQLIMASSERTRTTAPALRGVVQQFASHGVRSATLLANTRHTERAKLSAAKHHVDVRIVSVSAKRARVELEVRSDAAPREVALELPKNRPVLVGIGKTPQGLLVASVTVKDAGRKKTR